MTNILSNSYKEHKVFKQLSDYADFYKSLSFHILTWKTKGVSGFINLDTYVYSSIQGTLESINDILQKGRINDSFALLRKYYDSTTINVYSTIYLTDHYDIDNFIISQINDWVTGKGKIPKYRVMAQYIQKSEKLKPINQLLSKDTRYKNIRDRCNDHTHYNFYFNVMVNDNEIYLQNKIKLLDIFSADLEALFIRHVAYIFYLNDHYMMSSDYTDHMEVGLTPPEDSQYWVAPFIQDVYENTIKPKRPDLAAEIKNNSFIQLK